MKSFGDLVKQATKMQKQMGEMQEKLAEERFEASAGGGLVKAIVDGHSMLKELKLDPKLMADGDVTMIEDLVLTAIGEAQKNAKEAYQQTLGKITGGMNMPMFG
jgi:DNA-binding YbaB/EbfC family protein